MKAGKEEDRKGGNEEKRNGEIQARRTAGRPERRIRQQIS